MKFGSRLLLDGENDGVSAADADGGVTFANSFEGVFDLKEMAVR